MKKKIQSSVVSNFSINKPCESFLEIFGNFSK